MNRGDNYETAWEHAKQAARWIGDEPVSVSAPVDAQMSTTYALLAVADEIQALCSAMSKLIQRASEAEVST